MGVGGDGSDVRMAPIIRVLEVIADHLIDAVRFEIEPGPVLAPRQRVAWEGGFREKRHVQGKLWPVFIAELERDDTVHVAGCRVAADSDLVRVNPLRVGVVEKPTYKVLDLLDLYRELRLRGQVILDGVGDDAGTLRDKAHRNLKFVERSIGE